MSNSKANKEASMSVPIANQVSATTNLPLLVAVPPYYKA
jgi:hypothetical protein